MSPRWSTRRQYGQPYCSPEAGKEVLSLNKDEVDTEKQQYQPRPKK